MKKKFIFWLSRLLKVEITTPDMKTVMREQTFDWQLLQYEITISPEMVIDLHTTEQIEHYKKEIFREAKHKLFEGVDPYIEYQSIEDYPVERIRVKLFVAKKP